MSNHNRSITSKAQDSQSEDVNDEVDAHTFPIKFISSLAQRAYDATVVRNFGSSANNDNGSTNEYDSMSLPSTPWKLRYNNNGSESFVAMANTTRDGSYPPFNYLDLRRHQNNSWATSRFLEGVALAKAGNLTEAEACYHQGLDLVPNHAPMLVAYGALCANLGRTDEGIAKLEQALALNPEVENGRTYLNAIQQRQKQVGKSQHERRHRESNSNGLTLRTDKALQSAMAEHAIITAEGERSKESLDEKYPLLAENDVTSSGDDHHRRRRKGKKKKRKTKHHDSESSSDEDSRRRRKKRKKRRRNSSASNDVIPRRRHDSSS